MNNRVKLIRKQLNLTQEQLAQRLGVGKAALSMIETGKAGLSMRNRNILVQELNVNPDWLEHGTGEMFNSKPELHTFAHRTDTSLPLQSVPLYSIEGTAGLVPLFTRQEEFKPVNFIHIPNLPKCDGAIYIAGVHHREVYPEGRPRGLCEAREPESSPRRQRCGHRPHPRTGAREGFDPHEFDALNHPNSTKHRGVAPPKATPRLLFQEIWRRGLQFSNHFTNFVWIKCVRTENQE